MSNSHIQTLHRCEVHQIRALLSRTYSLCHLLALIAIFYYRGAFFFNRNDAKHFMVPFLPWVLVFVAELLMSFMWLLKQPLYWRPVSRTAFPEGLPKDEELPGIDVLICTADAEKEPIVDVMNTVISAMVLDYPVKKLSVYLSDDGGNSVTLNGLKQAWVFATWWLPFCRRYNVKTICPRAYFEQPYQATLNKEFLEDRKRVKEKYENFLQQVQKKMDTYEVDKVAKISSKDHPSLVQVINENSVQNETAAINPEHTEMPLLLYIAREKRPSHSHHFKAGALNVLLRVSSTLTNSPYILVLDCDMNCNDSISARQAMCFHLDPNISTSLGWVQFPHKFRNISESDIYDSQMKLIWQFLFPGLDGLQGPILAGTNFYIKRKALLGDKIDNRPNMKELTNTFGASSELIHSLGQIDKPDVSKRKEISSALLEEAHSLASCTYEQGTKWGEKASCALEFPSVRRVCPTSVDNISLRFFFVQVGFQYGSVVEDVMTSSRLQSEGWRSVYMNPSIPQFVGCATTNLDGLLTQGTRWVAGLLQIGFSKHCPLFKHPSQMHFLQKLCLTWIALFPLDFIPVTCFAIILPVCFFYGIPLYPKVFDPFFGAFAFVFISSRLKHLGEALVCGGSVSSWLNEVRVAMIKAVTCYVYGSLECIMAKLGIREASFIPTSKADDDDTTKWYRMGKYDFRTSNMFLVPVVTLVTLNLLCFLGGVAKIIVARNLVSMFAQGLFSVYLLVISVPVIEGMLLRDDTGRVPTLTTFISAVLAMAFLCLGYFIVLH